MCAGILAVVRNWDGLEVNRKKVHRIVKLNGWQKIDKPRGMRPRVQGRRYLAFRSDQLWAIDTTSIFCGKDGWCYLTAVIDCFDREIVGWRLSSSGKAKVAAAALEKGLRARGVISNPKVHLPLRSDNGLFSVQGISLRWPSATASSSLFPRSKRNDRTLFPFP